MKRVLLDSQRKPKGHYSPGMISNGMLYISGQLSRDPVTGKVPEGGIEDHMKLSLHNMDCVLEAAGLTRNDVVQCRIYTSDIKDWDAINELYQSYFGDHIPARIVVPVGKLHYGCRVEIEAIAECQESYDKEETLK